MEMGRSSWQRAAHVVMRDEQTRFLAEDFLEVVQEPRLQAQKGPTGLDELVSAVGRDAHGVFYDPVEREKRTVVEDDGRELGGLDKRLSEAIVDRPLGEADRASFAKTLFLGRSHDLAAVDQGGGRIVSIAEIPRTCPFMLCPPPFSADDRRAIVVLTHSRNPSCAQPNWGITVDQQGDLACPNSFQGTAKRNGSFTIRHELLCKCTYDDAKKRESSNRSCFAS